VKCLKPDFQEVRLNERVKVTILSPVDDAELKGKTAICVAPQNLSTAGKFFIFSPRKSAREKRSLVEVPKNCACVLGSYSPKGCYMIHVQAKTTHLLEDCPSGESTTVKLYL